MNEVSSIGWKSRFLLMVCSTKNIIARSVNWFNLRLSVAENVSEKHPLLKVKIVCNDDFFRSETLKMPEKISQIFQVAMFLLRDKALKNRKFYKSFQKRLSKLIVLPVADYGCQRYTDTSALKNRVDYKNKC